MEVAFIKIALAQIPVAEEINLNLIELKEAVDYAKFQQANVLLTPEGSLSGYTNSFDKNEFSEALNELTAYAKERGVGLALGTCMFEDDGVCYNELRFYLPDGKFAGRHTKQLLCGTLEDEPKGEIERFGTMPLRAFDYLGIKIGGLICNDLWANPMCTPTPDTHLARRLSDMGAKIIFQAVNGGRDGSVFSQETVRKFHETHILLETMAHDISIVSVDNAHPLDIGVSSKGGFARGGEWKFTLPEKGRQYGCCVV